jgi:hypothetical protein
MKMKHGDFDSPDARRRKRQSARRTLARIQSIQPSAWGDIAAAPFFSPPKGGSPRQAARLLSRTGPSCCPVKSLPGFHALAE